MAFSRSLALGAVVLLIVRSNADPNCNFTITGKSGSLNSPGFPGHYPNDQDCLWLITVPKGRYVMLNFTSFDVEFWPQPGSCIDMVEVKDGGSPKSELLGTFCSGVRPPRFPLYSSGNHIRLWFYSDDSDRRKGFSAKFTSFPETGCGGALTTDQGVITSPRYGTASPYPSSIECEWTITLDKEKYIKLWFLDIALELSSDNKCIDRIDFWDGPPSNETFLGSVCQGINPFYSKSNRLRIKFVTNAEGRGRGFMLRYTSSLTTGCGGDYDATSGNILSPNHPYSYPPMAECIWRINAPKNMFISIRFNEFVGMNGTSKACPLDHVEIRDGFDKEAKSLGRVCNYNPPGVIVSGGNQMWIRFQSSLSMTPGKFSSVFLAHSRGEYSLLVLEIPDGTYPTITIVASKPEKTALLFPGVQKKECNASLGMQDSRIDDTQLSASSYSNYYPTGQMQQWKLLPKYGRLNGAYAWCSQAQRSQTIIGEYFQIDFRNLTKLTAIATQGFLHRISTQYGHVHIDAISRYKIEFSFDASYWMAYSDGSVNSTAKGYTEFSGINSESFTVQNFLNPPVITNMIRVKPTNYVSVLGHMCLRLEVYGCPYELGCGKTLAVDVPGKINVRGHQTKETSCNFVTKPTPPSYKDLVLVWRFILFNIPCSSGYLILQHKSGKSEKLCDNNAPSTYPMRASEQMVLKVHLNKGTESEGFDITYKTESLGCGEIVYVDKNGTIASPRFPKNYGTEQNCTWILTADRNSARLAVKFKEFNLQPMNGGSKCMDFLQIKDGQLAESPLVDRYCGESLPMEFTSTGNSLRIEFHSDKETTAKGFLIDYVYLPPKEDTQLKDLSQQSEDPFLPDEPRSVANSITTTFTWISAALLLLFFHH